VLAHFVLSPVGTQCFKSKVNAPRVLFVDFGMSGPSRHVGRKKPATWPFISENPKAANEQKPFTQIRYGFHLFYSPLSTHTLFLALHNHYFTPVHFYSTFIHIEMLSRSVASALGRSAASSSRVALASARPSLASQSRATLPSIATQSRGYHEKVIDHYENPRNVSVTDRRIVEVAEGWKAV